jgi:hypothetical protein
LRASARGFFQQISSSKKELEAPITHKEHQRVKSRIQDAIENFRSTKINFQSGYQRADFKGMSPTVHAGVVKISNSWTIKEGPLTKNGPIDFAQS